MGTWQKLDLDEHLAPNHSRSVLFFGPQPGVALVGAQSAVRGIVVGHVAVFPQTLPAARRCGSTHGFQSDGQPAMSKVPFRFSNLTQEGDDEEASCRC